MAKNYKIADITKRLLLNVDFEKFLSFGYFSKIPQKQLFYGYLSYILFGTILLCLPFAQKQYTHIIDNFFVATSAISTTGLNTVSTADNYTLFGQIVILLLIQFGGIGYMTLSSFVILKITNELPVTQTEILSTGFSIPQEFEIKTLVRGIIIFTFVFELLGAVGLFFVFIQSGANQPVWNAIFHSISAFCTAGFGLYNDSFEQYKLNIPLNIIIAILSYAGGIGFIVLMDLWKKVTGKIQHITFTSKLILLITLILSIFGTIQLYIFEPSIQEFDDYSKLTIAFFQSMSAITTVGFNTISIQALHPSSLMTIIILMYIGASPSGTGGGMKSTTFTAVSAYIFNKLSLKNGVSLFGNKIPEYRVQAALSTFIFYTSILFIGAYFLTFSENFNLIQLLFEASSALGTVGLSTGITSSLSTFGKLIIILLMYIGRVGVITFGNALLIKYQKEIKESDIAI
ncbi:MAG: potassium transporter TrkH [Desulfobacterales bacterium]|nr:potassium transporter TrkH [Desulfobacterales bacterium]